MEKRVTYYRVAGRGAVCWPETIADLFKNNLSKYGVIYFVEEPEREADFRKRCDALAVPLSKRETLKCWGKDLYRHPFHYLSVQGDNRYGEAEEAYMDLTRACRGKGDIRCLRGARQVRKIRVGSNGDG